MTTDIQNIAQLQGMTSLQVSEATGKNHKNVLRDIRGLLDQGVSELNFELSSYQQQQPNGGYKKVPMYNLTPKGCLILASGYDPVLREKIIDKLEELNEREREALPAPARPSASVADVEASIRWIEYQRTTLGLDRRQVHRLMKREGKRLGVPVAGRAPMEAAPKPEVELRSATDLLRYYAVNATTIDFNKEMVKHGLLVEMRASGSMRTFKQLTKNGLSFGKNRPVPNGDGETWPVYYKDTFFVLCRYLGFHGDDTPF